MSQHTSGPWIIGVDNVVYDGEARKPICDVSFRSEQVNDQNALLIAAAPDLLAALEKVKRRLEVNLADERDMGEGSMTFLFDECSAAIARAKGESQ